MAPDSEYSFLRIAYFFTSIIVLGAPIWAFLVIPLMVIGLIVPGAQRLAELIFAWAVRFMLGLQPWLTRDIVLPDPYNGKRPGTLIVSNHRSHLDVVMLLGYVTSVRILARKSLLWVLPIAPMILLTRQILVPRGDAGAYLRAMETIRKRLRKGETVHVFPEMTRCEPGFKGTRSFSSAAFLAAMQEGATIVPVVFHNTDAAWPKNRLGLRPTTLRIQTLPALEVGSLSASQVRDLARAKINEALG